ncbi:hypothetical protein AOA12_08230 [Microbacterium sp. No. 7]|nr:hypothetical protein AOA12_08230 [Microbacterium sp. No. 7]
MSDPAARDPGRGARLSRILLSEESIYGLILVSGMIVVSNNLAGTSANALLTVVITVVVFFFAHVYAGTVSRLATARKPDVRRSIGAAVQHSQGMLVVALLPIAVLSLGVARVFDDDVAIWTALLVDALLLGTLGWVVAARWSPHLWVRALNALVTAGFGIVLVALKSLIHH